MDMDKSACTATTTDDNETAAPLPPQPANHNDPEEALLPDLGVSPTGYQLPVEVAAQQHDGYGANAPLQLEQQQQPPLLDTSQQLENYDSQQLQQNKSHPNLQQQQHQDPLNALTTLAVAAAPPHPHRHLTFNLLDIMTGPHHSTNQQQQQHGDFMFGPPPPNSTNYMLAPEVAAAAAMMQPPVAAEPLDLNDPAALAKALEIKDKEIKALRRALNKAQRKSTPTASRDSTASMIGEAVLGITKVDEEEDPNKIKNLADRWKARFQQLVRFKLKHGHCNVPKSYHDAPLHAWVRKQRINKQVRDRTQGVKGLTKDQVEALDSLGFCWVIGHQPNNVLWQSNYERLVQLYAVHGYIPTHCNDKSLTKWMQNQRARRKLLESHGEGKARGMSWERAQKLDALGFVWDARK